MPTNPGKDTPVVYVKKRQKPVMPVIPEQPKNPVVPNDSEQPRTPNQPDNSTQRATVSNSVTAERSAAADSEKESTLPQTGNDNNQAKAAMGLGLTSLSTIMAMFGLKKRRHN